MNERLTYMSENMVDRFNNSAGCFGEFGMGMTGFGMCWDNGNIGTPGNHRGRGHMDGMRGRRRWKLELIHKL